MAAKIKKEHRFSNATASALVVFIIIIAALMFYAGSLTIGQTETIAITTITDPTTLTETSVSTYTTNIFATVTSTGFTTVNYVGPDTIQVSGSATKNGIGNTATHIVFQNEQNQTQIVAITNGHYSVNLPNHHLYSIFIKYTTAVAGIGSGQCSAGGLILYYTGTAISASWEC